MLFYMASNFFVRKHLIPAFSKTEVSTIKRSAVRKKYDFCSKLILNVINIAAYMVAIFGEKFQCIIDKLEF